MRAQGSKFLILRESRTQHKIVESFSAFPHQVCQECSAKREYLFGLLFFHDQVPLIDQALVLMIFICLGFHQECSQPKEIRVLDSKDHQALSVPTEVCNC